MSRKTIISTGKDVLFALSSSFSSGAITLLCLFLWLADGPVWAQEPTPVTVREINAIPQANIDELNAAGAALDTLRMQELTESVFDNQRVRITVVVLSNPRTSGLGNPTEGFPSRLHVYVRDTTAASQGNEGMGIQLVDGAYLTTGLLNAAIGDVIKVVGTPSVFTGSGGASRQLVPSTIEVLGTHTDFGLPESILDPVPLASTADANMSVGSVQVNWSNLSSLNGQYVRLENAVIQMRDISTDRPNWLITTDGGETVLNFYDISLRYRNDRDGSYNASEFNVRDPGDDFVPPAVGATINLQGFLIFQGDDPFGQGMPPGALLSIAPFEDADLEGVDGHRYVAIAGSDSGNDCINPVNPCVTIAHAVGQANDGDILDVAAGTYTEPGLLIEKNLIIQGQGVVVQ